jgi:hypothetical protein
MVHRHRYLPPARRSDPRRLLSSITLCDGRLTIACGERNALVGITSDAEHLWVHLNGESHQYERALVESIRITGERGNNDIALDDGSFDMLIVTHSGRAEALAGDDECLHASRAQRRRRPLDDFGLV